MSASYKVPAWGKNWNKVFSYVVSDWTLGTVLQYGSGRPIQIPNAATSDLATALLRGTRAERVPGVPLFLADLNCHCFDPAQTQVLNPAAWKDPTPGTFSPSAAYYNDYRFRRKPAETLSLGRIFRIRERMQLALRAEFTNPFNRAQIPDPINGTVGAQSFTTALVRTGGVYTSGFGAINTLPASAIIGERSGLLVGRFTF